MDNLARFNWDTLTLENGKHLYMPIMSNTIGMGYTQWELCNNPSIGAYDGGYADCALTDRHGRIVDVGATELTFIRSAWDILNDIEVLPRSVFFTSDSWASECKREFGDNWKIYASNVSQFWTVNCNYDYLVETCGYASHMLNRTYF